MRKQKKYYLNVPFSEKDKAKKFGAKWDIENKSWYYTNPDDSDKFKRWQGTPVRLVTELSEEQQELIALSKKGMNVLVDACIGSGKTTAIQVLCNELSDRRILYLTYNKLLKIDAREKIRGKNVFVTNYHGFAYKCLSDAKIQAGVSDMIQVFLRCKDILKIPKYDLLVIDEYQDIEQEIAEMLMCIKNANPDIQIIAVGDMKQKIYDKTTLKVPEFISNFLGDFTLMSFTKCFRLSADIASRLGMIWDKEIVGVNEKCKVETMEVIKVVDFLSKQDPCDILCLGSRTGSMAKTLNILEEYYPDKFNKKNVYASIYDEDGGGTSPDKSTAIFTTFDSSKGLERKICIVFDYTEDYWLTRINKPNTHYEILRNIFCVASSRGKERIIFVKDNKHDLLSDETIATPVAEKLDYTIPFLISDMFSFKYKEDIEECYNLIEAKKLKVNDNVIIDVARNDELIDLSPCIGILQEASFFEKYNIDEEIHYTVQRHENRPQIHIKENATLEEKVLYLTAYETYYDRYVNQVNVPFVNEKTLERIHSRLRSVFSPDEAVQKECEITFKDCYSGSTFCIEGRVDVLKDNMVYELKFTSELSHEHFLQCACYMVALGLKKGILWNIKDNERYLITIPDRKRFLNTVIRTITKGNICDCSFSEKYNRVL